MVAMSRAAMLWCYIAPLLMTVGSALRMPLADKGRLEPEPTRIPKSRRAEYQVPSEMPESAEIVARGRRWTPLGWVYPRAENSRAYFDIHIPKTAGCSFSVDVKKVLPAGQGFYSKEVCINERRLMRAGDAQVAFLRDPTMHVYSQFLECKYDDWGQMTVRQNVGHQLGSVSSWLEHFKGGRERSDYGCYHPYNMMTRAFTCRTRDCHHHYQPHDPPLEEALRSLDGMFFVGITEHYQASLCLFFSKTHGAGTPLPKFCNCKDREAWGSFGAKHESHHTPPHSISNLTQSDLTMISALTRLDRQLYEAALTRFKNEVAEVESSRGVKLLC